MKKSHLKSITFLVFLSSVMLACRIGGVELQYDQESESWIEPITGLDFTHLAGGPGNLAPSVSDNIEAIANAGEICVIHAETSLCKAVLSRDMSAIESLPIELQVADLIYLSEALSEAFAGMNASAAEQP